MSFPRIVPAGRSAFHHREFRWYWTAQLISLMGTFMQVVALGYLIYDTTGSKWLLGLLPVFQMGPSLLLSLPAGVLADRVQRRRLIIGTQTTALILAFCLATLTATHQLRVWEIIVILTISGIAIAVESPARQAFVSDLVGPKDLANAIAWNSLGLNGARVLGPAVGGVAIRFVGVAPIFYYNSLSFLAMIVALSLMRLPEPGVIDRPHPWAALAEGMRYIRRAHAILLILALTAVVGTFIMNFSVIMPVLARDIAHTNATGLGWMWTALGVGAVAGSLTVVRWSRSAVGGPLLLASALLAGGSTLAMAFASQLVALLALLLVLGWSTGTFFASANSAIQYRVHDAVRGRVLSVYTMIFSGTAPIGGLFTAAVASAGGASLLLLVAGTICVASCAAIAPAFLRSTRVTELHREPPPAVERAS
jgi:MFS family permease